jgi:hypothetical protein
MSQPPNQPYPDQPGAGQPGRPDHSPTQPYPIQPGQPYQGLPNPDVPTSVPPQPGFPPQQPSYPQPGYGQPEYGQPGYPQPGPPMPGYPPAPKAKSRALPITLMSIAVVLVLCLGGGTVLYLVGRNNTLGGIADSLATPTPTPTPTPTATVASPPTSTITVVAPKTLGGRRKVTDPKFAGAQEQLRQGSADVKGATKTVAAIYGNPAKGDMVVVAAAATPIDNPQRELDGFFAGADLGQLKLSGITVAEAGKLGGVAKCAKGKAGGAPMIMCGWADEGSIGWVTWYYTSMKQAKNELPKIREQVEKKSN